MVDKKQQAPQQALYLVNSTEQDIASRYTEDLWLFLTDFRDRLQQSEVSK